MPGAISYNTVHANMLRTSYVPIYGENKVNFKGLANPKGFGYRCFRE